MPAPSDPLVRLLGVLQSGLSLYLADSGIGSYPGADEVRDALAELAADQRRIVERTSEVLVDREQVPPRPHYPLAFTAVHDLDLATLLTRVLGDLRRQVPALEAIVGSAGDDAAATTLAGEAEALSRRHAATLEQLAVRLRAGLGRQPAAHQG
jgi:hypothetical protein